MYEVMFYTGIVVAAATFLLAVFLFFFSHVPASVRYFLRMGGKKAHRARPEKAAAKPAAKKQKAQPVLIASESTELLGIAQNYATALLEADSTVLLPDLAGEEGGTFS